MALSAGSRLGPYTILELLGTGGMGEVYRARDARLGREVAVKVLPAEVAADTDRRTRFEQEARAASALNHPGIVTVYDVGSSDGTFFIAMELVEGQTLRQLLSSEPLSARRALDIGSQVAEGLAKAHGAGIVHRDLKPENIMVSSDGFVKILDFGLAKLAEIPTSSGSHLPTASPGTAPGMVLGTVGYMSPEQASGRSVDFRSDQFSFGSILYEILTGKRAFERGTGAETLVAIIREEPPAVGTASPATPAPLRWLVERCLAKDPKERYAATSDLARDLKTVREHLSELSGSGAVAAVKAKAKRRPGWLAVAASFLLGALATAAALRIVRPTSQRPAPVVRPLTYSGRDFAPAVSPDGKTIAFVSNRDGRNRIWVKQLSSGAEAALTEGPDDLPRFSPDGSMILFVRSDVETQSLYRQSLLGGEVRRIARDVVAADWSPDGERIVFLRWSLEDRRPVVAVWLIAPDGSGAREITRLREVLSLPRFSPDSTRIILSSQSTGGAPAWFVVLGLDGREITRVQAKSFGVVSAAAWNGNDEIVYSQALSASGAVVGVAGRIVVHDIRSKESETVLFTASNGAAMNVAGNGRLVFETASSQENLREFSLTASGSGPSRWLTRGQATDRQPAYSPDGEWVLFSSNRSGNLDLWEVSTKSGSVRRLTDDAADDWDPGFTPDGKKIIWSSNRSGPFEIWIADSDGGNARQLTQDGVDAENPTATRDGWVFYASGGPEKMGLWKIRADGTRATRIVEGRVQVPDVSPDGRYVAYSSLMDGTLRVVRAEDGVSVFSTPTAPSLAVATTNQQGVLGRPRWMPDGKAIAFVGRDENAINGVYVQDFVPGADTAKSRRMLGGFDTDWITESLGLSPDGARLTIASVEPVFGISIAENVPRVRRPR